MRLTARFSWAQRTEVYFCLRDPQHHGIGQPQVPFTALDPN
jgi:hypothetical protein